MTSLRTAGLLLLGALAIATSPSAMIVAADVFPTERWTRCDSPRALGWSTEKLAIAREFSDTIDTAAFMIVQGGVVVDEWGATALPLRCHSVRKSLLSALYGIHVAKGAINLDQTLAELGIDDNEPSLTDTEREATVRDLLKARSGVYHPALYETKAMAAKRPQRGSHRPNTFWYYNNWDFNALATIFERRTARSLFEEFEDQIAEPLRFQDFRRERDTAYVSGDDSVHAAYPFQLSTRDLARFGLLFLRNGKWGDQQLIPADWVRESTTSYSDTGSSGGYGYMWWVAADRRHFPGVSLPDGAYSARGYRGQYLVVIPEWDLVICHRCNSFQAGTAVSKTDFAKLLGMIVAARPEPNARAVDNNEAQAGVTESPEYDTLIRQAIVIDGTGRDRFAADVAIRDGRIARMGDLKHATASNVIDATAKIIVPGFVDLHSHAEEGLVADDPARRSAPNLITQGITTVVVNQDGGGPLDLISQRRRMRQLGVGVNVAQVLGHGSIRGKVLGDDFQRPASEAEVQQMQQCLRTAMEGGAFGMSAGLEYAPGIWSRPQELEALAQVIGDHDGVYICHERSSGRRPMWFLPSVHPASQPSMMDNLYELAQIAASSKARIVATHIKAKGTDFWGSSGKMIELIEQARAEGLALYADQYPYNTSGSDGRVVLIPDWVYSEPLSAANNSIDEHTTDYATQLEKVLSDAAKNSDLRRDVDCEISRRGGGDQIVIIEHRDEALVGQTLAQYAGRHAVGLVDAAIHLQVNGDRTRKGGARLRGFSMSEKDVEMFARTSWTATASDAGVALPGDGPVHPRFYGAFPRKLRRFAIDHSLMSLEEAVRVSTSLPATILGLSDRGVIREGAVADVVVLDPVRLRDKADAFDPHQYAEGIDYVFVGGNLVCEGARWLGNLAGEVLTRSELQ